MSILLQFRAIDTHDVTKGLQSEAQEFQFYYSFVRTTRTILRKGCSVNSKRSILLRFRAIDRYDFTKGLHFRKHFPDHGDPVPWLLKYTKYLSKVLK